MQEIRHFALIVRNGRFQRKVAFLLEKLRVLKASFSDDTRDKYP
jgi:hypothetical protein